MKIIISKDAQDWFENEMDVVPGDEIRFFARYGGSSPLHESFSLGVTKESPDEAVITTEQNGAIYYIESRDQWYFLEHDLHVNVDLKLGELIYSYEQNS
ncbi:HesB/YadR/YfhF family protein [Sporosarcina sp. CAU 1771]